MSTSPTGPSQNYNLDNLAFPRVILASLELPMLSSEVRTWGELLVYVRANSWNLPAGTYEDVQALKIQYAMAGPAVPLVPPAGTTLTTATSTPTMQARGRGRGRGNRGSGRAGGRVGRQGNFEARGGGSPQSTTPIYPTPVAKQSEGLSQVALPSRRFTSASPVHEYATSVPPEPGSSRTRQASEPAQKPSQPSSLIRVSPSRRGSVVLNVIPGSNPKAGPKVFRSYTHIPIVGPSAMVRMAPSAQSVPDGSQGAVKSSKDSVQNSNENWETKTKATVHGTIIDSEIPTNVSEALAVFPSLLPKPAV